MQDKYINNLVKAILKEFAEQDVRPGKKIRFRPKNSSMDPIHATILSLSGDKIKLKIDNPGIAARYGKDTIIISTQKNDILSNINIAGKSEEVYEGKFAYDKKTATMKQDDSDPDQRHGLYKDGKLVKTYNTKGEADNVKSRDPKFRDATVKKIAEGGMGGLNRCAPSQDVSYENILNDVHDKWKGQTVQVNELSAGTEKDVAAAMNKYRSGVKPEHYYNDPHIQKKVDRRAEKAMKLTHKHHKLTELSPGTYDSVKSALEDPNRIHNAKNKYQLSRDPIAHKKATELKQKALGKDPSVFHPVTVESYADRLKKFI